MGIDPSIPLQIKAPSIQTPDFGTSLANAYKLKSAQLEVAKAQNEEEYKLLSSATPDNYAQIRQMAVQKYGPDADKTLPPVYDKSSLDNLAMSRLTIKDKLDLAAKQHQMEMDSAKFDETKRHNQADETIQSGRTAAMYPQIPGLESLGYSGGQAAPSPLAPVSGPAGVANPTLPAGQSLQPPPALGKAGQPLVADSTPASPTSALLPPPGMAPTAPNPQSPVSGTTPTAPPAPQPDANNLQGQAFLDNLKKVNPAYGNMVQAIINGEQPMPPATIRGGRPNPLALAVNQAAPGMSSSDWNVKNSAQKDFFGGGKNSQSISALNTAMQHAGVLLDKVNALHAGNSVDFPAANAIRNTFNTARGNDMTSNFATAVAPLAQEITSAYRGSGGAEADIQAQIKTIGNPDASLKQQIGALNTIVDLMNGRVNSLKDQYDSAMNGTGRPLTVIRPETAAQIAKIKAAHGGANPSTTVPHDAIDAELAKRGVK